MKTIYHTKDVWMNRYSIKIEPILGTWDAHVRVYYNETPEKNDQVSVLFNEPKLLKTQPPLPSPPVFQTPTPARRRS